MTVLASWLAVMPLVTLKSEAQVMKNNRTAMDAELCVNILRRQPWVQQVSAFGESALQVMEKPQVHCSHLTGYTQTDRRTYIHRCTGHRCGQTDAMNVAL